MLHAKELLDLFAGQTAGRFTHSFKHLLAHGVEMIAHAFSRLLAGVNAVVRCSWVIEKRQVACVHKEKAPKGLASGQERREFNFDAVFVINNKVTDVIL